VRFTMLTKITTSALGLSLSWAAVPEAVPMGVNPSQLPPSTRASSANHGPLEATTVLLRRLRAGDIGARDMLFERCLPALRRWARGRLPDYARNLVDTNDLVQDTLIAALKHVDHFDPRHDGALMAYLRQTLSNRIRDEIRRVKRRPTAPLDDAQPDCNASPLDRAIGRQGIERYERALRSLNELDREAIVLRIELQHTYEEIAALLAKPSSEAARAAVVRALAKLVREMDRGA
jgi:RNA polymerase sigma-70 factor, ECF subfamily